LIKQNQKGFLLKDKRIIFVFRNFTFGGAERQAFLLTDYLKNVAGSEIIFIAFSAKGRVSEICDELGIKWVSLLVNWGGSNWIKKIYKLFIITKKLRSLKPDIIFPYTYIPSVICGSIWKLTGAKFCLWNNRAYNLFGIEPLLEKISAKLQPVFISNSEASSKILVKKLGIKPNKAKVIRNGIELSIPKLNRSEWRKKIGASDNTIICCMVANIHGNKDHITLLKAWVDVNKHYSFSNQYILVLAGRCGGTYKELINFINISGINSSVKFLSETDDVSGLVNASDIGVFSSLNEGSPNGLLECMAAGLPIVAADIPSIREIFDAEQLNFLSAPKDHQSFSKNLITVFEDPELRKKLGTKNKEIISNKYSKERMINDTIEIIEDGLLKR
jgi:glycosyltransferase involved in cell wall biosynthesis